LPKGMAHYQHPVCTAVDMVQTQKRYMLTAKDIPEEAGIFGFFASALRGIIQEHS